MKRKGWFGTVALAIILGLFVSGVMHSTKVSASMKGVDNDSLNPDDAVVIEHNITLDATVPEVTTPATTPEVKVEPTTTPTVEKTEEVDVTEPSTTTQTPVQEEEEKKEESNNESHTEHGCDHMWRCEYQPATETTSGYERMECCKCGESYVVATYPPTNN